MDRISAYKTSDGRIHTDRAIARKHQAYLDLVAMLHAALGELDCEPDPTAVQLAATMLDSRPDVVRLLRVAERAEP